jgi:hypothetical protein
MVWQKRVLAWPIELGSLSPGWGDADAASGCRVAWRVAVE